MKDQKRRPLSAERVIEGAVALADEIGIDAFTIRKLAEAIDVKPMTIYHHTPSKEAIIDGMVDRVFSEIDQPPSDLDWRSAMQIRCRSMRKVLAAHPWAAPLMDARTTPGFETLRHHNAVLGCFRSAGFSIELTGHAYAVIDAFLYGFALQEATIPTADDEEATELSAEMAEQTADNPFPYLTEFAVEHVLQPDYDFGKEFEVGLNIILDGLERMAKAEG